VDHRQKRIKLVKVELGDDLEQVPMDQYDRPKEIEKLEEQRLCEEEEARHEQLDQDKRYNEVMKPQAE
jgi:hypothetical protein